MTDTAAKRASAISPACPWRGLTPPPDGDIDAGDRQAGAFLYSGTAASTGPAGGGDSLAAYLLVRRLTTL